MEHSFLGLVRALHWKLLGILRASSSGTEVVEQLDVGLLVVD